MDEDNRIVNTLILTVYKVVNEILYMSITSPLYSYCGLTYKPVMYKAIISYLLFFVICSLPLDTERISSKLLSIYIMFTMIPLLSLYWQSDRSTTYMLCCFVSYIVLYVVCSLPNDKAATVVTISGFGKLSICTWLLSMIIVLLLAITAVYGVADTRAFDMNAVYEIRGERVYTGIFAYIINWLPYAMVPCLLCISLRQKKYLVTVCAVAIQFYLYLFTGSKTTFFSIMLILVSYYLVLSNKNFIRWWASILSVIIIITSVIYVKTKELMPYAIFPVRLLSIPASISNNHYDFFSQNPKLHFAENIIGRLFGIKSPYNVFSTYLVSTGSGNANTGLFGDAYDNGGFICMILYVVILALILRYIDRIFQRVAIENECVFIGILTYSLIYLNDGTLTAVLLTGGLLFNIFILSQLEWCLGERYIE